MRQFIDENEVLIRKIEINNCKIRWICINDEIYINGIDLLKANVIPSGITKDNRLGTIKTTKQPYLIIHRTKGKYTSPIRYFYIDDIIKIIQYDKHIWNYIKRQGDKQ